MKKVLFLSHTDIRSDSRILKEMTSINSSLNKYTVFAIGVNMTEGSKYSDQANILNIEAINILSRSLSLLPKILTHIFIVLEIFWKILFKSIKIKPDIIHCNDVVVLPLGVFLKLMTRSNLIYDAHELESDRNGLSETPAKLTKLVEKTLWPFVDFFITVSPSINQWYQENLGEKQSEIILNSPILKKLNKNKPRNYLRNYFSIDKRSMIFIYVGILGKGRGIEKIIQAFSNNMKSNVVFVGFGDMEEYIKLQSKKFKNIHIHAAVPHEQVVDIVKSADIGLCLIENVSLSDYYCLPNKLFEYSFAGIPVLASEFPDISTIVKKYNLGKCSELDASSIYNAIKEFEEMTELPKINTNDLYDLSWEAQEKKIAKLYSKLFN